MTQVYETERELQHEIEQRVASDAPDVDVLAVELSGPDRFCVYIDRAEGVDHALCERVTGLLRGYLDRYAVDVSSPEWRLEKVSYAAAYGDERIPAYLFLPKQTKPPYQTIVFFPGSGVISQRTSPNAAAFDRVNFIMRSGRALLYPIYKSTH